ncbi:MAG: ATP-dependent RNA helicase dbp7 [Vezdaea acicularis]|nr:MAG: ATP-dependent RNA helicase dbp7 [Vezdaea acicularis]
MAEDDDMLVNFAVPDGLLYPKQPLKGGRWRDRLSAKKAARHRIRRAIKISDSSKEENSISTAPPTTQNGDPSNSLAEVEVRPSKRPRIEEDADPLESTEKPESTSKSEGRKRNKKQDAGTSHQVISSLFSFNPKSTVAPEKTTRDDVEAEPSNAPLADGISTFTTLGLSPTLANHLLTKLELKSPTAIQKGALPQLISEDSDAFIQAETGSGKTLAYLLPIVQRLTAATKEASKQQNADGKMHRDSGLFAIILAPTRELCRQVSVVLESLMGCAHWLVAGTVIGGEKKKSEKARLRKGLNILVATPGRLADHLANTEALDVSNVRWLVLDEGDRLMELGFEEEIQGIIQKLAERSNFSRSAFPKLPKRRITVLCSATMKMNVQRLGEISLKDAIHLQASPSDSTPSDKVEGGQKDERFSAPAQLKQSYAIVPAKLRLVTLVAVLKRAFARQGSVKKAIVFFSCADSVDFHFSLLSRNLSNPEDTTEASIASTSAPATANDTTTTIKPPSTTADPNSTIAPSPLLSSPSSTTPSPAPILHRLHGSLPPPLRTSTLSHFSSTPHPSILLSTDLSSRGLDLPNVDLILEYDPPFSLPDHLHRIGRTARAGHPGRALIFLLPGPEEGYIPLLQTLLPEGLPQSRLTPHTAPSLLLKTFGNTYAEAATSLQLAAERTLLASPPLLLSARRAFQSSVRAYATHVLAERHCFDVKTLHLGHLAKAFALRDRPGEMAVRGAGKGGATAGQDERKEKGKRRGKRTADNAGVGKEVDETQTADVDAEAQRRMRRKWKQLENAGAGEFNIA